MIARAVSAPRDDVALPGARRNILPQSTRRVDELCLHVETHDAEATAYRRVSRRTSVELAYVLDGVEGHASMRALPSSGGRPSHLSAAPEDSRRRFRFALRRMASRRRRGPAVELRVAAPRLARGFYFRPPCLIQQKQA